MIIVTQREDAAQGKRFSTMKGVANALASKQTKEANLAGWQEVFKNCLLDAQYAHNFMSRPVSKQQTIMMLKQTTLYAARHRAICRMP